ncbi:MAG: hypothetical protein A3K19_02845 [Lentisphaerae bacterium RIFOXYB12_FULL_65_16]|nr:MAG: hypothetical protein A3K18_19895 [Lentisphaerae bacterium RIFOXYA12_64_32]OGV92289.1 MAG: hypothetical protein A3K19_02845 [Lentisphaerae bacterium RIFOXYB12_FULL_65_16]
MTATPEPTLIPVKDLCFDRQNPRLAEYGVSAGSTDDDILALLWDVMDIRELVQSIAASGFFQQEAVIVAQENGKNIVIEGNRRLAAVKVLLDEQIAKRNGWDIPIITPGARQQLRVLPAIISTRGESWRYLGFKHVNGPAKWSSYAKAKYIADVHHTYGTSLSDISSQIGDRHRTVQRLFRGLKVLEQAERAGVFDLDDKFRQRLAFSHLYTGLDYDGISSFISLKAEDEEAENPVPEEKLKELGELCVWLYGSKKGKRPPVVESQNPDLRRLNAVLSNREAIAALRASPDLAKAFEISRPPTAVFEEALLAAKRELTTASAHLTAGYDRSEALLRIAGTIANMADDIYREMDRKLNPDRKQPRLTEV